MHGSSVFDIIQTSELKQLICGTPVLDFHALEAVCCEADCQRVDVTNFWRT